MHNFYSHKCMIEMYRMSSIYLIAQWFISANNMQSRISFSGMPLDFGDYELQHLALLSNLSLSSTHNLTITWLLKRQTGTSYKKVCESINLTDYNSFESVFNGLLTKKISIGDAPLTKFQCLKISFRVYHFQLTKVSLFYLFSLYIERTISHKYWSGYFLSYKRKKHTLST